MLVWDKRSGRSPIGGPKGNGQRKGDTPANYNSLLSYVPISRQNGFGYRQQGEPPSSPQRSSKSSPQRNSKSLGYGRAEEEGDGGDGGDGGGEDEVDMATSFAKFFGPSSSLLNSRADKRGGKRGKAQARASSPSRGYAHLSSGFDTSDFGSSGFRASRPGFGGSKSKAAGGAGGVAQRLADRLNDAIGARPHTSAVDSRSPRRSPRNSAQAKTKPNLNKFSANPRSARRPMHQQRPFTSQASVRKKRSDSSSRKVKSSRADEEKPDVKLIERAQGLLARHDNQLRDLKGAVDMKKETKNKHHKHIVAKRQSSKKGLMTRKGIPVGDTNIDVEVERDIAPHLAKYLGRLKDQRTREKEQAERAKILEKKKAEQKEKEKEAKGNSQANHTEKEELARPKSRQEWTRYHARRRLRRKVQAAEVDLDNKVNLNELLRESLEDENTRNSIRALHSEGRQTQSEMESLLSDLHSRNNEMRGRMATLDDRPDPVENSVFNNQIQLKYEQRQKNLVVYRESMRKLKRPQDDPCSICLTEMEVGATVIPLGCKHVFHADCLLEWLSRSEVCPMCKKSTVPVAKSKAKAKSKTRSSAWH